MGCPAFKKFLLLIQLDSLYYILKNHLFSLNNPKVLIFSQTSVALPLNSSYYYQLTINYKLTIMKKTLFPFLLLVLAFVSCKETEDPIMACGVADPIENLPWLNEKIEEIKAGDFSDETTVNMATYQGQTIFFAQLCCALCLSESPVFYDCQGEIVEGDRIILNLEDRQTIWKSKNSKCNS